MNCANYSDVSVFKARIAECYNRLMPATKLSHTDQSGKARMVDVSAKPTIQRTALARGQVVMAPQTLQLIRENKLKKGDVLAVAQIAGIQAAKSTADLIPFCHPLPLDHLSVDFTLDEALPGVCIEARAECAARTGVEMEALTAVSVAALTIYDMAKSADKAMTIDNIRLVEKTGGQSGDIRND